MTKDFAKAVIAMVKAKIYIGWQDNDREINRIKVAMEVLSVSDEFDSLDIGDDEELLESIMKRIIQHYSLD